MSVKRIKIALVLTALFFLFTGGWQIGACELANIELKDDMQDMASQFGVRIGLSSVPTDTELRDMILRKAEKYEIPLSPDQVTVVRTGSGAAASIYLAADYTVPITLPHLSFTMHFTPSTGRKPGDATMAAE
jgi:hypothetical protein